MQLDPADKVAMAAVLATLPLGSVEGAANPWIKAPFWARDVHLTNIDYFSGSNPNWVSILRYPGSPGFRTVLNRYALTTREAITDPGIEFQVRINGAPVESIIQSRGVEAFKVTNTWPIYLKPTLLTVGQGDTLEIYARNLAATDVSLIVCFAGWSYPDHLSGGQKEERGGAVSGGVTTGVPRG